jgi:hypothetical protein
VAEGLFDIEGARRLELATGIDHFAHAEEGEGVRFFLGAAGSSAKRYQAE